LSEASYTHEKAVQSSTKDQVAWLHLQHGLVWSQKN